VYAYTHEWTYKIKNIFATKEDYVFSLFLFTLFVLVN
jgi:hypothetical protein